MSGAVELLACPFCGSEAKMSVVLSADGAARGDQPSFDVECSRCWVWHRWDNEADAAWNTRAPDPAVAALEAEVARLREAVALWLKWSRIRLGDARDHPAMMAALEASWALESTFPAPSEKEAG